PAVSHLVLLCNALNQQYIPWERLDRSNERDFYEHVFDLASGFLYHLDQESFLSSHRLNDPKFLSPPVCMCVCVCVCVCVSMYLCSPHACVQMLLRIAPPTLR